MTKRITCLSGKGGVGKSTTSINLGLALHQMGESTAVLDGNLTTPNVGIYLGVHSVPNTIHHVLSDNKKNLNDAVYSHKSGLKVIPGDLNVYKLASIKPEKLKSVVSDIEGVLDYLVIDGSAGLGRETYAALDASDQVLVVTNPEMPAITDALKTLQMANKMKKQILGVIVTKHTGSKDEVSLKQIEEILEYPVIGVIPHDERMKNCVSKGSPIVQRFPKSEASMAYKKLAASLLGKDFGEFDMTPPTKKKEGLIKDLLRIFSFKI